MSEKAMTVERVEIRRRQSYENNPGHYVAEVQYSSPAGKIETTLSPEVSERLLGFVGPLIAQLASKAAQEIAANIYRAVEDIKQPVIEEKAQGQLAA